jgi:fatty-acyl-CoA synthase
MIDPSNVPAVDADESLARYVLYSRQIRKSDETIRPEAFIPHPYQELSVTRHREATEEEIIDFCKEHIARFKAPATVEFTDLPKTSTGKVQKFILREKEWAEQEKRVH